MTWTYEYYIWDDKRNDKDLQARIEEALSAAGLEFELSRMEPN